MPAAGAEVRASRGGAQGKGPIAHRQDLLRHRELDLAGDERPISEVTEAFSRAIGRAFDYPQPLVAVAQREHDERADIVNRDLLDPGIGLNGKASVQQLLGPSSMKTTMTYTHALRQGGRRVESPLDRLELNFPQEHTETGKVVWRGEAD